MILRSELEGYANGLESGRRVPREPDDTDRVHAMNFGPDYARGFLRAIEEIWQNTKGGK